MPEKTLGDVLYADARADHPTEREWVALTRAVGSGDQLALHALYDRAHHLVFTSALRITSSRETAEELTVDVFHEVWRRAKDYDPANGTVLGWIMNLARSRSIDRLRFEQRQKRSGELPAAEGAVGPPEATEQLAQARELREALQTLSNVERIAIEEAFFSGLTHVEVAERLKEPIGTVKTRIRAGLQKLRGALSGEQLEP